MFSKIYPKKYEKRWIRKIACNQSMLLFHVRDPWQLFGQKVMPLPSASSTQILSENTGTNVTMGGRGGASRLKEVADSNGYLVRTLSKPRKLKHQTLPAERWIWQPKLIRIPCTSPETAIENKKSFFARASRGFARSSGRCCRNKKSWINK